MKKTWVMATVTALFSVAVLASSALAQNRFNNVNQSTAESVFFGFVPTPGNIQTFTQNTNPLVCVGVGVMTCSSTDYVKNTHMPGSYTDRPDSGGNSLRTAVDPIVSVMPDFGCGVKTTGGTIGAGTFQSVPSPDLLSGSGCLEAAVNLHDRVNGNVSTATLSGVGGDAVNSGNGQNTAPTAQGQCAGNGAGQNCGTLVGSLVSTVTIAQEAGEDGMPSGSITFSRTDQGIVDFAQSINQVVAGLYTFAETDVNGAPFQSLIPGAPSVPGGICNFPTVCNNDAAGRTSGGTGALPSYVGAGLPITATLSLVQEAMGGEPGHIGQDTIGYTVNFPGNGEYPIAGAFFTPGLNVADWAGNGVGGAGTDTSGFPN